MDNIIIKIIIVIIREMYNFKNIKYNFLNKYYILTNKIFICQYDYHILDLCMWLKDALDFWLLSLSRSRFLILC